MGTSAGWRDVYDKGLAYQWVDVSATAPGRYLVASRGRPRRTASGRAATQREVNAPAFAQPAGDGPGLDRPAGVAPRSRPRRRSCTLAAAKFGSQANANLRYRIVGAPVGGTLNVPVGGSFDPATQQLTYTPKPGYLASTASRYAAYSVGSTFPTSTRPSRRPRSSGPPSVAISGMPAAWSPARASSWRRRSPEPARRVHLDGDAPGAVLGHRPLYRAPARPRPRRRPLSAGGQRGRAAAWRRGAAIRRHAGAESDRPARPHGAG